ncbi:MAG: prepilin-type N-terminal cleavage/methylation domain-containing protein [Polyangiaceae bacterium]
MVTCACKPALALERDPLRSPGAAQPGARRAAAGYTLIEIMAAVTIVGILAVVAITSFRKYFSGAYSAEARSMLQGLRAAQLMTMSDRLLYESCTSSFGTPSTYYPSGGDDGKKYDWAQPVTKAVEYPCWQRLNVRTDGPVRYGYATVAGVGATFPTIPVITTQPAWPALAAGEPWFVVAASGDIDRNGRRSMFWASSLDKQINVFQDAE